MSHNKYKFFSKHKVGAMKNSRKRKVWLLQKIRMTAEMKKRRQKNANHKRLRKAKITQPNREIGIPRVISRKGVYDFNHCISILPRNFTKADLIRKFLPDNFRYLIETESSPFYSNEVEKEKYTTNGIVLIPENFSIVDNPQDSYHALKMIVHGLLYENKQYLVLDYKKCNNTELETQALLDLILMDYFKCRTICQKYKLKGAKFSELKAENINDKDLQKMIWSVGSPVNLGIKEVKFPETEKFKLKTHDGKDGDIIKQKDIDTSRLLDYLVNCLRRMKKQMSPEKISDMGNVIGETLINAEEHSTLKRRFSIGYFTEYNENNSHYGLFNLVIMNFGKTIYQKFKSDDCPNKTVVYRMKELSKKYTEKGFFNIGQIEEECLWTLYALQEGVTSVSPDEFSKRGNGSIQFIESFFNIKGSKRKDDVSQMTLVSGNTNILFDGTYEIQEKIRDNQRFKMMTFNNSGNIEEKPDNNYVKHTDYHFPGTIFRAKILINDDDLV